MDAISEKAARLKRLIAAAPDHAVLARLFASGELQWDPQTNELCYDGLRHATELDEFGVPLMTVPLRYAISRKEGSNV